MDWISRWNTSIFRHLEIIAIVEIPILLGGYEWEVRLGHSDREEKRLIWLLGKLSK